MKYLIFKIIGILGLIATPIIMNSLYPLVEETGSIVAGRTWLEGCELFLIIFLIITMAGFSRFIAKVKAYIDFYTDFDDDQHLECYPKLKIYSFIKKISVIVFVVAMIVVSILKDKVAVINNNFNYILLSMISVVFLLFLINIIICLAIKLVPLHFDISIVLTIIAFVLESTLIHFGLNEVVATLIAVPIFAFAALYFACAIDEFISIDEIFDWLCYEEYKQCYSKLCEKEKSQESKDELSKNKQAKQKKIENKPIAMAEKKQAKQTKKEEKRMKSEEKKTKKSKQ